MILDQKQIRVIFLFEFKMDHKAVEIIHDINNAFGPRTDNLYVYSAVVVQEVLQRRPKP